MRQPFRLVVGRRIPRRLHILLLSLLDMRRTHLTNSNRCILRLSLLVTPRQLHIRSNLIRSNHNHSHSGSIIHLRMQLFPQLITLPSNHRRGEASGWAVKWQRCSPRLLSRSPCLLVVIQTQDVLLETRCKRQAHREVGYHQQLPCRVEDEAQL